MRAERTTDQERRLLAAPPAGVSPLPTPSPPLRARAETPAADGRRQTADAVPRWLFTCAALVVAMVLLGGATRLSGSGLSIVHWEPIMGAVPPLTAAGWDRAFAAYRETPEFRTVNAAMTLDGFERIYLVEYAHRLLGRITGLALLVPFVIFAVRRKLTRTLLLRGAMAVALVSLQGLMGWWMVKSGLVDQPRVSPLRLAAHLGLALMLFSLLWWTALDARRPTKPDMPPAPPTPPAPGWRWFATLSVSTFITALWGALVAGHHAGWAWNTFPLMDGQWIPAGLGALQPWWRNPFENVMAVQFTHRALALFTVAIAWTSWAVIRRRTTSRARRAVDAVGVAAALQVTLGISTLLLHVPPVLGLLHQAGAVLLLGASLTAAWVLRHVQVDRTQAVQPAR